MHFQQAQDNHYLVIFNIYSMVLSKLRQRLSGKVDTPLNPRSCQRKPFQQLLLCLNLWIVEHNFSFQMY